MPRPVHTKQKEGVVEEFKKNSSHTRRNAEALGGDSKKISKNSILVRGRVENGADNTVG